MRVVIGKALHQSVELAARHRARPRQRRIELLQGHRPEIPRCETQLAEAQLHEARPREAFAHVTPKVAFRSPTTMRRYPAAPPSALIIAISRSLTSWPAPRRPAPMMRIASRAPILRCSKRWASARVSSPQLALSSLAIAPSS